MSLIEKYDKFLRLKWAGRKKDARRLAGEIIQLYRESPELEFVYKICEECEHRLDHFIWKEVVFPELIRRMHSDPIALKAMIQTIQNLYSSTPDWESLDFITSDQLTIKLLEMCPTDLWAREQRMTHLYDFLNHAVHEWPSGILYGMDGATFEQCDEILDTVVELRALDENEDCAAFCDDVEQKTIQYQTRLTSLSD